MNSLNGARNVWLFCWPASNCMQRWREYELLDTMRVFAHEMHEAVQGTPTALELDELFNREPPMNTG